MTTPNGKYLLFTWQSYDEADPARQCAGRFDSVDAAKAAVESAYGDSAEVCLLTETGLQSVTEIHHDGGPHWVEARVG